MSDELTQLVTIGRLRNALLEAKTMETERQTAAARVKRLSRSGGAMIEQRTVDLLDDELGRAVQRHAALLDALAVLIATAHCEPDMTLVVEVGDLERLLRQATSRATDG